MAKALPEAKHGQWFEYQDHFGTHWCQPDLLLETKNGIFILEAKLTWVPAASRQLELYQQVVEKALLRPVAGVVVCRNLSFQTPLPVFSDLFSACEAAASSRRPSVLHWLGKSPLIPQSPPSHPRQSFSLATSHQPA